MNIGGIWGSGLRPALAAACLTLAACGSQAPAPVSTGPLLEADRVASFQDSNAPARAAEFSLDGQWLATASAGGAVNLRHLPDLKVGRRLQHSGGATSLAFSPDGKWLATGGYDGVVRLWDLTSGAQLRALSGAQGTVWTLSVSPDGRHLAVAGEDSSIRIWNAADGKLLRRLTGHERNIWEVSFSPDGKRLASGSFDATLRLWDAETGAPLQTRTEHQQAVVGLAWSPDGHYLASGGDDSTIFIRRGSDGAPLRKLSVGNHAYKLAFSPDGKWLANGGRARSGLGTFWHQVAGGGGTGEAVRVWRVDDGALVKALKLGDDAMYVAFSPDGKWLAAASEDSSVTLWRLRNVGSSPRT